MFHYDLNDLLLLQAISDCQNLTRGAEKIGLTAPSASVRIRKLEDVLKVKLLKRSPKGVELTSAGKLVVDQSKKVFWAFEGMASSLRPFIRKEEGVIKIFANYGAAIDFLPYDLAEYMAVHNEISFVLEQRPSLDVVRAVSTGEADIGISVCEVIPESLRSYPYHEDRLVAIVPENHPLADRTHVNFKELLTFDSVGLSQNCSMQLFLCKKAVDLGLPMKLKVQVDNPHILFEFVSVGVGYAIVSQKTLEKKYSDWRFKTVQLNDPWARRELKIFLPQTQDCESNRLEEFKDYLQLRGYMGKTDSKQ